MNQIRVPARGLLSEPLWIPMLVVLAGYVVFNRGFAYLGIYPLFIGEWTLAFYLLLIQHKKYLVGFLRSTVGQIWLLFFIYNLLLFFISAFTDFSESIRNSIYWVYSIYLYIGYVLGVSVYNKRLLAGLENYLYLLVILVTVYTCLIPIRSWMLDATDFFHSGVALLGYYSTHHAITIGLSVWPIVVSLYGMSGSRKRIPSIVLSSSLLAMIIALSQSRAAMLGILAIIFYMFLSNKTLFRVARLILLIGILGAMGLMFAQQLGVTFQGYKGELTLDLLIGNLQSIFVETGDQGLRGTRADRLEWWLDVIERTSSNPISFFFGLGLNEILLERVSGPGTILRYPHNSFVSVFGFSGLIGLILYVALVCVMYDRIVKATSNTYVAILIWYPVFFIGYMISAFFSTVFEAPFHSAVFWMISGVCVGISKSYVAVPTDNLKTI